MDSTIRYYLKNKTKGVFRNLPYTVIELKNYLESKFENGMTWENMGEWHIDHIVPVSRFNFTTMDCIEFKQAYSLSNLQPLWEFDNLSKNNKLTNPQISIGI